MQPHVSSCKPLKKRDVRPFVSCLMEPATHTTLQPHQPVVQTPDSPDFGQHQKPAQLQSVFSSRRSSDSGIATTDPSDSDSPAAPEARTPGTPEAASKEKPKSQPAKRTPFCGRCRNHWPDKPVLVRGHKKECPMRDCTCSMCRLTLKRQKVMATQVRVRRSQASHKKHAEILQIAERADTIDIDLDDDAEGSGFSFRLQPKIPVHLLNSLKNSETTKQQFQTFLEQKINDLISAFTDQQRNGDSTLVHRVAEVTTSGETSPRVSAFTSYIGSRTRNQIDDSALAASTALCQSLSQSMSQSKLSSSPSFALSPFVVHHRPQFSGVHAMSSPVASPPQNPHPVVPHVHHFVDQTKRFSHPVCHSISSHTSILSPPEMVGTWNTDVWPVIFPNGTLKAA